MSSEVHKLLQEFNIRMDGRGEGRRTKPSFDDRNRGMDDGDDDFGLGDMDRDMDDDEFEFGSDDDMDDEFGSDDMDRGMDDDEFEFGSDDVPPGLDDMEDDGTFAGERRVDITDRLKRLLSRRGESEDEFNDTISDRGDDDFDLSSLDDYSGPSDRMRGHDDVDPMDDLSDLDSDDDDTFGRERPESPRERPERSRPRMGGGDARRPERPQMSRRERRPERPRMRR